MPTQSVRDADQIEKTLMLAMSYNPPKQRDEMLTGLISMMAQTTAEKARDRIIIGNKQECIDKIDGSASESGSDSFYLHAGMADDGGGRGAGVRRGSGSCVSHLGFLRLAPVKTIAAVGVGTTEDTK